MTCTTNSVYRNEKRPEGSCLPVNILQRKILFVILFKIQSLGLGGNTLAGIIAEFAAFTQGYNALLDAKHLLIAEHRAVAAVGAGLFYLLRLYTNRTQLATVFCRNFPNYRNQQDDCAENRPNRPVKRCPEAILQKKMLADGGQNNTDHTLKDLSREIKCHYIIYNVERGKNVEGRSYKRAGFEER